jgi:hypothetical protein
LVAARCRSRMSSDSIQIGKVDCWPAVKVATMTSSRDKAKASMPPASAVPYLRQAGERSENVCEEGGNGGDLERKINQLPGIDLDEMLDHIGIALLSAITASVTRRPPW